MEWGIRSIFLIKVQLESERNAASEADCVIGKHKSDGTGTCMGCNLLQEPPKPGAIAA